MPPASSIARRTATVDGRMRQENDGDGIPVGRAAALITSLLVAASAVRLPLAVSGQGRRHHRHGQLHGGDRLEAQAERRRTVASRSSSRSTRTATARPGTSSSSATATSSGADSARRGHRAARSRSAGSSATAPATDRIRGIATNPRTGEVCRGVPPSSRDGAGTEAQHSQEEMTTTRRKHQPPPADARAMRSRGLALTAALALAALRSRPDGQPRAGAATLTVETGDATTWAPTSSALRA